jgi:hypothetical protein
MALLAASAIGIRPSERRENDSHENVEGLIIRRRTRSSIVGGGLDGRRDLYSSAAGDAPAIDFGDVKNTNMERATRGGRYPCDHRPQESITTNLLTFAVSFGLSPPLV